jgi:four helix bundle protein
MTFEDWERTIPADLRGDALWKRQDYRYASFVADTAWMDVDTLAAHPAMHGISSQLYKALGSIAANIAEGYSRGTSADRVRFFEYALGSARESREWYRRAQPVLGPERVGERSALLTSIIRLLLVIIPAERSSKKTKFTR